MGYDMTHFTFIRVIGQTNNRGVTVKSKLFSDMFYLFDTMSCAFRSIW